MRSFDTSRWSPRSQRGTVTLVVAIVLLIGITFITFFANRSIVFEQRTSANQYRSTKALAAAEAGQEWALAQLNTPFNLGADCTTTGGTKTYRDNYLDPPNPPVNPPASPPSPVYARTTGAFSTAGPACARQSGGGWSCSCPAGTVGTPVTFGAPTCDDATAACPKFVVEFARIQDPAVPGTACNPSDPINTPTTNCVASAVRVTTTGYTDSKAAPDGTAKVSQMFRTLPGLVTLPSASLTARTAVNLGGNVAVANTDLATNGITINAGGNVTVTGSVGRETLPGTAPDASVAANDSSLSALNDDQMFQTYFGMEKTQFRNMPTTAQITCGTCTDANILPAISAGASIIWVNGDLDLNNVGPYGSLTRPVIIVVTGNIRMRGGAEVYGLVYSQADVWDNSGGGTATICGAAIAEGAFTTSTGGLRITYCPGLLNLLRTGSGSFAKVPGSWRDFPAASVLPW